MNKGIVVEAMQLAEKAHAGQFRRDGKTPYIKHPASVVSILRARGESSDEATAVAWLHDVLEDTDVRDTELIDAGFPDDVIQPVLLLTRGEKQYDHYLMDIKADPIARKVKVADMLANLSDHPTEKQILKYARGLQVLLT